MARHGCALLLLAFVTGAGGASAASPPLPAGFPQALLAKARPLVSSGDAALFFEASTSEECDPDLAVKQLEQISSSLQQLSPADQDRFRSYAFELADRHPNSAVADGIRSVVNGLMPLGDE